MSWESTVTYYQAVNQGVKKKLGGLHSAKVALLSVDFHEIEILQHADRWNEAGQILAEDAARIEAAGDDLFVLSFARTPCTA
jgi:aspartate racemase